MGRRSKPTETTSTRQHALLGWGAFLAGLLGFCAPQLGMSINASIALAGTCLSVFFLLWFLGVAQSRAN